MNTTTARVATYAGASLAAIAASCVLAAPALAMRPDPTPGTGQHLRISNTRLAEVMDANSHAGSPTTATSTNPTPDGVDWSNLVTVLGGAAVLTGVVAAGAIQLHHRQARPA